MKKQKVLLSMFLCVTTIFGVMPNNAFASETDAMSDAVYATETDAVQETVLLEADAGQETVPLEADETMSEEFRQILNEEGKLVVTDTTISEDKTNLLRSYLGKYSTDTYYFIVSEYDKSANACYIVKQNMADGSAEGHTIELVFEEQISDDFKRILKDGKLEFRNSSKNLSERWLESYIFSLGNPACYFNIASDWDENTEQYVKCINDDFTEATIVMRSNNSNKSEQHAVKLMQITTQSDEFKRVLNEDGKLVFNSVKPKNEEEMIALFEMLFMADNWEKGYSCENISDDFSSMDFTINAGKVNQETHTVEIVYNYDKTAQEKLQDCIDNFPKDVEYFKVKDMEVINYWVNTVGKEEIADSDTLAGYSGELKAYTNNYNIKLKIDNRAGANTILLTKRLGMVLLIYNNIAYYVNPFLGAEAEQIIYVPDTTGDSKEELIAAAQKRINEYLGKDNIVTVSYGGKAYDAWVEAEYEWFMYCGGEDYPDMTLEDFKNTVYADYENFEDVIGVKGVTETTDTFKVTIKVGDKEESHYILIRKDSSKMITPSYKTADMGTNVEISSASASIPLDTNIQAKQLTDGQEYEKIIKLLDVEENVMYDLKLYSNSLQDYVTKLDDGLFEVKIPMPDNLKNKKLVAYYVNDAGKLETFEVEVKDGYAVFKTNHFSIYTLAESKTTTDDTNNKTETTDSDKNNNNPQVVDNNAPSNNNKNNDSSPKTGDNVFLLIGIALIDLVALITTIKLKKYYEAK